MSHFLRRKAIQRGYIIDEQGFVKNLDLRAYLIGYEKLDVTQFAIAKEVRLNGKSRFVLRGDSIACWSGHTIPGVIGPAVIVPTDQVPEVLCHGTYKRHVEDIQREGIRALTRSVHYQNPLGGLELWRKELEVFFDVDARKASADGVVFKLTGNGVWLSSAS